MCSSSRGPARLPSLVTWPTRKTGVPERLAISISRMADSRTWLTLPGAEVSSALNMVWIESITSTSGRCFSTMASTAVTSISETTNNPGARVPRRWLRSRIWRIDSSPET